ncbi:trypsin-like peptidase domain-containing protein [Vibrio sonorensis]|uniref:trypsin-like peptidase domain-containing protein n=1 Tax=Vibrio sonorensis TaxID=1004316 RepID=UPI001FE0BB9B|nr:trypsin-like peptidase domain-containing protein [Vibrio sonorensis]
MAIGISDSKYRELGGTLSRDPAVVAVAYQSLRQTSFAQRFSAVGKIVAGSAFCTGTWLGNHGDKAFILTAAHCVAGDNKTQESTYFGQRISFRTGDNRLIASGQSNTHFLGFTACQNDLAIVELPLLRVPVDSEGNNVSQPVYADEVDFEHYVGQPMTLLGYGLNGTPSLEKLTSGRAWGIGVVTKESDGCLQSTANTDSSWAFITPGDSGSTSWQWREGQLVGVGVTSWWGGWQAKWSGFGRIAPHHEWMKRIFPNINTVTRSRTLTESKMLELKDVEAHVDGTVYYLAGDNVAGPQKRKWAYPTGLTMLVVPMLNQSTGERKDITLRAQRQTHCGWGEINNGVYCFPSPSKGGLRIWYKEEDNSNVPAGLYTGMFSLEAKGWHDHDYNEMINLNANILIKGTAVVEDTVTEMSAAMTSRYDQSVKGSVYYLPQGEITSDVTRRTWSGRLNTWSTILVPAINRDTNEVQMVSLRASRFTGCGWGAMNNGVYCSNGANYGQLRVSYHQSDNQNLPNGSYDGLFNILVKGWHSHFEKVLTFKLDIDKENE